MNYTNISLREISDFAAICVISSRSGWNQVQITNMNNGGHYRIDCIQFIASETQLIESFAYRLEFLRIYLRIKQNRVKSSLIFTDEFLSKLV